MKSIKLVRPLFSAVLEKLNDKLFGYMQRMGLVLGVVHTAAESHTDSLYYITAALPGTYDAAGYAGSGMNWSLIDRVSKFPGLGRSQNMNEFIPISGAVEYTKGAPRFGTGAMECADMPLDAGQIIVKAASESTNHYSIKQARPDGAIIYLDVLVSSWQLTEASEGAIALRTATLGVCKAPVLVAAP